MIDIDRVRADTVGCHDLIHFNNAGAALPPRQVVDAQVEFLRREARYGGYETKDSYSKQIESTYGSIAALIGAHVDEIAFTSNATESFELAFASIALEAGDRVLTAQAEYSSNFIAYLHAQNQLGISVEVIPSDEHGQTDPVALEAMLDDRVKLISVSHMPTNGGLINPAADIGKVAKAAGIPYLLDACQTIGQLHIDVEELACDILTMTGRKYLRGPRGTGVLYMRRSLLDQLDPPFLDNHGATWTSPTTYKMRGDARRYETWEFPYAAIVGLGVATEYAMSLGTHDVETRVVDLAARLRASLDDIPSLTVRDLGLHTPLPSGEAAPHAPRWPADCSPTQRPPLHEADRSFGR